MAYNAVPTVVTGQLWTAADHNTYIRDNFAAGIPDIFTLAGQIPYATGANAVANLAIGAAYQLLSVNSAGTLPSYQALGSILKMASAGGISADTTSTIFIDIPGATVTLPIARTSTVLALAMANVTAGVPDEDETCRMLVDDQVQSEMIIHVQNPKNGIWTYIALVPNIAAGSKIVKIQYKSDGGGRVHFYNGNLIAIAIPTA